VLIRALGDALTISPKELIEGEARIARQGWAAHEGEAAAQRRADGAGVAAGLRARGRATVAMLSDPIRRALSRGRAHCRGARTTAAAAAPAAARG
jgi:hypothetical protein